MDFFNEKFYYNTIGDWLIAAAIVLATVVFAKLIYWLLRNIIKKITLRTKATLDDILLESLQQPIVFGMAVFGIWFALDNLDFPSWINDIINKSYFFLIFINITWVIASVVAALIEEYLVPIVEKSESDLDDQLLPVIRKTLKILIWSVGVIIALNNVGFNVGAVLAGMGIGGLGCLRTADCFDGVDLGCG